MHTNLVCTAGVKLAPQERSVTDALERPVRRFRFAAHGRAEDRHLGSVREIAAYGGIDHRFGGIRLSRNEREVLFRHVAVLKLLLQLTVRIGRLSYKQTPRRFLTEPVHENALTGEEERTLRKEVSNSMHDSRCARGHSRTWMDSNPRGFVYHQTVFILIENRQMQIHWRYARFIRECLHPIKLKNDVPFFEPVCWFADPLTIHLHPPHLDHFLDTRPAQLRSLVREERAEALRICGSPLGRHGLIVRHQRRECHGILHPSASFGTLEALT